MGENIFVERENVRRLVFKNWHCEDCRVLGWDKDCTDKDDCMFFLYRKLGNHFIKWGENAGYISRRAIFSERTGRAGLAEP